MTSTEQFEAWYLESWGRTEDNHDDSLFEKSPHDGKYYRFGVRLAWKAWQAASKASEQQLAAVVAENAHMQQVIGDVQTLYCESDGIVGYHLNGEIAKWDDVMPDLWAETPATDAYLAELGAQIRNELIDELESRFTELSLSETLSPELKSGAAGAAGLVSTFRREPDNEFAAQLRQGAKS